MAATVGVAKVGFLENPEWIVAATGALALVGAGIRYVLKRIDTTDHRVDAERQKLEAAFNARVGALEEIVGSQRDDIRFMQSAIHDYARHVGVLEGLLKANGIDIPPMVHTNRGGRI